MLTNLQLKDWHDDGMLILEKFFTNDELDSVERAMREVWQRGDGRVVVDDLVTNRRCLISALHEQDRGHRFKTNDLYLTENAVRELAIGPRMASVIGDLLGEAPVLCNSLNFDYGSAQDMHADSLYMTPLTRGHLCAIWVAMEDVTAEAGPLFFFRGSHKIRPFRFSDGGFHALVPEMDGWRAHMELGIAQLKLQRETFLAKRGDVFIWSADLLHGGSPIQDSTKTRKSIVLHYFTKTDCDRTRSPLRAMGRAFWMARPRQHVPEDPEKGPHEKRAPNARGAAQLHELQLRVAKLEAELARLKEDPFRLRLTARRVRKWARLKARSASSFVRSDR